MVDPAMKLYPDVDIDLVVPVLEWVVAEGHLWAAFIVFIAVTMLLANAAVAFVPAVGAAIGVFGVIALRVVSAFIAAMIEAISDCSTLLPAVMAILTPERFEVA